MIKILPKIISRYENENGFKLPNIKLLEVYGGVSNIWRAYNDEEDPVFNYVGVKIMVDVKDGRLGRVKKISIKTLENILDTLGYRYNDDDLFVEFVTEENDFV